MFNLINYYFGFLDFTLMRAQLPVHVKFTVLHRLQTMGETKAHSTLPI